MEIGLFPSISDGLSQGMTDTFDGEALGRSEAWHFFDLHRLTRYLTWVGEALKNGEICEFLLSRMSLPANELVVSRKLTRNEVSRKLDRTLT